MDTRDLSNDIGEAGAESPSPRLDVPGTHGRLVHTIWTQEDETLDYEMPVSIEELMCNIHGFFQQCTDPATYPDRDVS